MSNDFDHGLDLEASTDPLGFEYGPNCFGPQPELRRLDDIRPSLRDPDCDGPSIVYAIAMHVGDPTHRDAIEARHLCYGVVTYAAGQLGDEPIRSQGHVHRRSPLTGRSTPELYEVWSGRAIILMQESDGDDPGRCFAVDAGPGDMVLVPPGWAHATISGDPSQPLTFGAWCDRDYGFEYQGVKHHGGLAWYPIVRDGSVEFEPNRRYEARPLERKQPAMYAELGLDPNLSIWRQFTIDPDRFAFVHDPRLANCEWESFTP